MARQRDFIVDLSKWENSNNQVLLEKARKDIIKAHSERLSKELGKKVSIDDIDSGKYPRPRVLDPFAGGGSYPLEALRLGCETYASDYNPVAVLIEKATLEYPQKFGRPFDAMPEWAYPLGKDNKKHNSDDQSSFLDSEMPVDEISHNPLLEAVRYWGNWVLEEARKEVASFYPNDTNGSQPVGYLWARTIACQNPGCGHEIPLMRQFWLSNKKGRKISLYPEIDNSELRFIIVGDGYAPWPEGFDPENGTVARAVVTCPFCGSVIDDDSNRRLFKEGHSGHRLIVVILAGHREGKRYRIPTIQDEKIYKLAEAELLIKQNTLLSAWGIEPVPDEMIPPISGKFNVTSYGMNKWGDLYNNRQLLSLLIFVEQIKRVHEKIILQDSNSDFAKAVLVYLAINLDRMAAYLSSLGYWHVTGEKISPAMQRQSLAMVFDYVEANPFGESFSWATNLDWILRVIVHCSDIIFLNNAAVVTQSSATHLSYPDLTFDAILTDPPYYYSMTYADLSDFYYVWLKRCIGFIFPDLFATPLSPKADEIIEKKFWIKSSYQDKNWYEEKMRLSFIEIYKKLKENGIAIIVYAHKTTEGWETLINSLLDSGLVVTSSWPINTEMQARLVAHESAALASSIYIVARKMPRYPTGFYNDVRTELRQHLYSKLHRLWEEGIGGADFFIAAIGSAIEIFGKYEQIIDYEGKVVRADRLLEEVRTIATDYAVRQILHNGFATEISPIIRLYVLWRWNYSEALVPFDEGRKLAQSCGIDLSQEWGRGGFVKKEKEFIRLLGPHQRKLDDLDEPRNMIDVLHKALLLWEKGKRGEMIIALADRDYGRSEAFYRVAQAISETLLLESKEKKLLDGFLAGRERLQEEVEKVAKQGRLFD